RLAHVLEPLVDAGDGKPVPGRQHRRHDQQRPRPRRHGRLSSPNALRQLRSRRVEKPLYAGATMLTDAELVASARSGDRGALSETYDSYADRLYDLCTSVLRDPEAAFDAMVDTFVLAALELYRLRRPEKGEPGVFALGRQELPVGG